jgi:hypothetical protein
MTTSKTERISISLSSKVWEGVLFHLEDTVEHIPISIIEPDPYECVSHAITAIKAKLPLNQEDLDDL